MKILSTSTVIAAFFLIPAGAWAQVAQVPDPTEAISNEGLEDGTFYVAGRSPGLWIDIGMAEDVVYDDAGRVGGILIDIADLDDTGSRIVFVEVGEILPAAANADPPGYVISGSLADLATRPPFVADLGTAPRVEQVEDTDIQGTGLTTQAGPGNETFRTDGKELEDAREPIAGDLDVQSRIVDQENPSDG